MTEWLLVPLVLIFLGTVSYSLWLLGFRDDFKRWRKR